MKLNFTKQSLKFVDELDAKQYRQVISSILSLIKQPYPHDSIQMKGVKNKERRMTVGEYRVIYGVNEKHQIIEILFIGKHNDGAVYKSKLLQLMPSNRSI